MIWYGAVNRSTERAFYYLLSLIDQQSRKCRLMLDVSIIIEDDRITLIVE